MGEWARNTTDPVYPELADAISAVPAARFSPAAGNVEIADASFGGILFILSILVDFSAPPGSIDAMGQSAKGFASYVPNGEWANGQHPRRRGILSPTDGPDPEITRVRMVAEGIRLLREE
jgi:hypothetical protein